jgi:transcriptional regulator with XRE-family HTH domain
MRKFNIVAAKKRIKSARLKLGLTQTKLASKIGISRANYSALESIKQPNNFFKFETLLKLKDCLGVSYDYIIEGIEDDNLHEENMDLKQIIKNQNEIIILLKQQMKQLKEGSN